MIKTGIPHISAIVMASGRGKRMQESGFCTCNKLLMQLSGKPIYRHVFELLEKARCKGLLKNIYIVSQEAELLQAAHKLGFVALANHHADNGKSQSIIQGVSAADTQDALMFFVADQPLLSLQSVEKLVNCYQKQTHNIVYSMHKGISANPVIFPPQAQALLKQLQGDEGGKKIFKHFSTTAVEIEDPWEVFDMDRYSDYLELQEHITPNCTGPIAIVRGAGDIASAVIQAFVRSGFRVIALELPQPLTIRRTVAYSEAVYQSYAQVEDVAARLCHSNEEIQEAWERGECALIVDPELACLNTLPEDCQPTVLIDASLAKKDIGTRHYMAPITLALGPGYNAGTADDPEAQVDAVIETMRGHNLGRLITKGPALANTGIPGNIAGYSKERVIHAPASGTLRTLCNIGDLVKKDQIIGYIDEEPIYASLDGLIRGYLKEGLKVQKGLKIADIDPRGADIDIHTISDKARNLGGSCLQAALYLMRKKGVSGIL